VPRVSTELTQKVAVESFMQCDLTFGKPKWALNFFIIYFPTTSAKQIMAELGRYANEEAYYALNFFITSFFKCTL